MRLGSVLLGLAVSLVHPWSAPALATTEVPRDILNGYLNLDALLSRVEALHEHDRCAVSTIGTSRGGRPLVLLTLSSNLAGADARPAVLLAAGLDGTHLVGSEVAIRAAEALARDHAALLEEVTFYIVPLANPDAAAAMIAGPFTDAGGALRVVDEDHDGLDDEDGPVDLDGNGVITMMRRPATLRDAATHLADPGAPRLLRTPDAAKGERAAFVVGIEGVDADGDGRIGEDGIGRVDLDRNFMHLWNPEVAGSGPHPLSEPEALALARFVLERKNLFAAVTWGRHDNVVDVPKSKDRDRSGRAPKALHEDDLALFEELARLYRDTTGQSRAEGIEPDGSFHAWLYAQRGLTSVASTVWGRPDVPAAETTEGDAEAAAPDEAPKPADAEAAAWLEYSDRMRDGAGFIDWAPFDHPDLGAVEVGGLVPGFRRNPPAAELDALAGKQLDFAIALAERRPRLRLEGPTVAALGPGVYEIRVAIVNDGHLPTLTAMAATARSVPPTVIRISTPIDRIVAGERVSRAWGVSGAGGRTAQHWIVRGTAGETVEIVAGAQQATITLP